MLHQPRKSVAPNTSTPAMIIDAAERTVTKLITASSAPVPMRMNCQTGLPMASGLPSPNASE